MCSKGYRICTSILNRKIFHCSICSVQVVIWSCIVGDCIIRCVVKCDTIGCEMIGPYREITLRGCTNCRHFRTFGRRQQAVLSKWLQSHLVIMQHTHVHTNTRAHTCKHTHKHTHTHNLIGLVMARGNVDKEKSIKLIFPYYLSPYS